MVHHFGIIPTIPIVRDVHKQVSNQSYLDRIDRAIKNIKDLKEFSIVKLDSRWLDFPQEGPGSEIFTLELHVKYPTNLDAETINKYNEYAAEIEIFFSNAMTGPNRLKL